MLKKILKKEGFVSMPVRDVTKIVSLALNNNEAPRRKQRGIKPVLFFHCPRQAAGYEPRFINLRLVIFGDAENDLVKSFLSPVAYGGTSCLDEFFSLRLHCCPGGSHDCSNAFC